MTRFLLATIFMYAALAFNARLVVAMVHSGMREPRPLFHWIVRWMISFHVFNVTLARVPIALWKRWVVR